MPSYKEDPAVSALLDQLLGSTSLGESVERNIESENNNEIAKENTLTRSPKFCSACGKESDKLKYCNGCKCVWYCDKDCQKRHRKEHKKECKRINKELDRRGGKLDLGIELYIGPLGKLPPRDECPICMQVLPIHEALQMYSVCCGKTICCGCNFQHQIKSREQAVPCAFCRSAMPGSDEEILVHLHKRVEGKDLNALHNMAMSYGYGQFGLPIDQAKCIELMQHSAGLGCPTAKAQLGSFHYFADMGLEENEEEALKYWEKAAEEGHLITLHYLGCIAEENGDHAAAMRHWRLSASGGSKRSIEKLMARFARGLLHHADLSETLQAYYLARSELKSEDRDKYIEYLKMKGEYKEEYDC